MFRIPYSDQYIYTALLLMVRSNNGTGFRNGQQFHPAYQQGMKGIEDYSTWGDDSRHNDLFKLMLKLSKKLRNCGDFKKRDHIDSWADFCKMAYKASQKS